MAINIQTVPITPEYPKMIGNQQTFVYVSKLLIGNKWYTGNGITGKSTTETIYTGSGVTYANIGDIYMNIHTGASRGNLYRCTVAGDVNTAKWVYFANVTNIDSAVGTADDNPVVVLAPNIQRSIVSTKTEGKYDANCTITLTLPTLANLFDGYICEVDFKTGLTAPYLVINNSTGLPIKYVKYGITHDSYIVQPNKEINLLFRYNGLSILCVIVEIDIL